MKYALIIGNNKYDDPKLAQLKTPAADSQALAKVLDDKTIGSFDEVTPLINQSETKVRRSVSAFLADKKPDDLVLLYFSGHGVLDDRGRLYLALKDTQWSLLKATSIPSSFVADEMDSCRSRRQILVLDCCHSGAFARGTKGEQKAITETTFEGSGFGRVVLTASDSTQYALEGDQVIKQTELSLFTHFLLEGLKTGEADMNNDGHISLDEWYDYTYTKVISETPRQVPHKWSYNQQGDLIIARNPFLKKKAVELPYELVQALESPFVGIRESAVNEVGKYLKSRQPEMVDLAIASLKKMKDDDSRRISLLAERLLSEFEQARISIEKRRPLQPAVTTESVDENLSRDGIEPVAEIPTAQPAIKALEPAVKKLSVTKFRFNQPVWGKWLGSSLLIYAVGIGLYFFIRQVIDSTEPTGLIFSTVAGLAGLVQWRLFRNGLKIWWVSTNAAAGFLLGSLHHYLYNHSDWSLENLLLLIVLWSLVNFTMGMILIRKPKPVSAGPSPIVETGTRGNIFMILLSVSLILAAIVNTVVQLEMSAMLPIFWVLYGISAVLVSVSYFVKKDLPRNFGFITLVLYSLIDASIVVIFVRNPDSSLASLFLVDGIIEFASGVFFISQKETWRNPGFLMLSGYLILSGAAAASVTLYDTSVATTVWFISSFFAVPAAIYFLLRK